jgi:hypothetical protein
MSQNHLFRKSPSLLGLVSSSFLICAVFANGAPRVAPASRAQAENQSQHPDAELRKQVQGFYDLLQASRYAEAEAFVIPETRQNLRNQSKGSFISFDIKTVKIDSSASPKTATVTTFFQVLRPPIPTVMPMSITTTWLLMDGTWLLRVPKPTSAQEALEAMSNPPPKPPPEDLKFESKTIDLGTVNPDKKTTRYVEFTNISDHPVSLEVETFCTCLTVKNLKREYQPKETGHFILEFNPGDEYRREYGQTILVRTTPGGGENRLTINAYIPPVSGKPTSDPKGAN